MRVFCITTFFAPIRIIESSITQVYKTIGNIDLPFTHLAINNHYPVNKDLNDKMIETMCNHYGIQLFDEKKNLGLSGGLNYLLSKIDLQDDDLIIGLDNDVWPTTNGWGKALIETVIYGVNVGWSSLMYPTSKSELLQKGYVTHEVQGSSGPIIVWEGLRAVVNSVCCWSGKMIKQLGNLSESGYYYGGLESVSFPKIKSLGWKWVYTVDYEEAPFNENAKSDRCYVVYKWEYAHNKSTQLSFEDWLLEDPNRLNLM
jgi:hypothetical protein